MTLLAPLALLAAALFAGPLLAHWLGRPAPRPIALASMRFLAVSRMQVTRKRALQDPLLLALRLAAVLLIVLFMARPATYDDAGIAVLDRPHTAIAVVDTSASMQLRSSGKTLLSHAYAQLAALAQSLPAGSQLGLLTTDPEGPSIPPTQDFTHAVRELDGFIAQGHARPGGWPMGQALARARRMQAVSGDTAFYVITDRTELGLGALPIAPDIVPIAVGDKAVPAHVGLERARWTRAPELGARAVVVEADVFSFGHMAAQDVHVELVIDNQSVGTATVTVPPGERATATFTPTLPEHARAAATLRILHRPSDPLPMDDARHLWLEANERTRVLMVNGDPSEYRTRDEGFFFATALSTANAEMPLEIDVHTLAPSQLEDTPETLASTDVLVLANVPAPSKAIATAIVKATREGMGVLVTAGSRMQVHAYNDVLGELLPLRLREVVQTGTLPGRTTAVADTLAPHQANHPLFRGTTGDRGLMGTTASRLVLLDPAPERNADVALQFVSGAPALITRMLDRGRVALLTTSLDRDWTTMPLQPGYVALMHALVSYLAGTRVDIGPDRLAIGETYGAQAGDYVTLTLPGGQTRSLRPDATGRIRFGGTNEPGHYETPEHRFVVFVPDEESNTREVQAPPRDEDNEASIARITHPRWRELVPLLLLLLLGESVVRAQKRQRQRRS